ncbi:MAG: glycine betaine ABC transporter substrate-binding protein [Psychroflexus sp.]
MNKTRMIFYIVITTLVLLSTSFLLGCSTDNHTEPEIQVKFAANYEFVEGEEGLQALQDEYNFHFDEVYEMAIGLTHEALREGDVDVAIGFATDGKIEELNLINLEDDKNFFPVNYPAPVIREEVLKLYPKIAEIMSEISARLDTDTMIHLHYLVDIEENKHNEVARYWLLEEELISETTQKSANKKPVIVGSKKFTEHQLLGQIAILSLENSGIPVEDHTNLGDTAVNRSALMKKYIHMYWEDIATAWINIFKEENRFIADPEKLYQQISIRDAGNDLVWLDYAPVNNSYSIMMRKEHAKELEITTISELAEWIKKVQAGNFPDKE